MNKKELGAKGEHYAATQLMLQGYHIIARNWRCPLGEIDIVCKQEESIVFVEVRTRTIRHEKDLAYGTAIESINRAKQARLRKLAECFLIEANTKYANYRFDIITVSYYPNEQKYIQKHYKHAF